MKTFLVITTLFLGISAYANELTWVDEQVNAIKPPRTGMRTSELNSLKDPFIFLTPSEKKKKKTTLKTKQKTKVTKKASKKHITFKLRAIMNQKAMINNRWYKVGDSIHGYTLKEVNQKSVLLTRDKKKVLLTTKSKVSTLKFTN
jgi:hypothetical protein